MGHFKICELISEIVKEKNPSPPTQWLDATSLCCPKWSLENMRTDQIKSEEQKSRRFERPFSCYPARQQTV